MNYTLNPAVKEFSLTVTFSIDYLESLGWDFDFSDNENKDDYYVEIIVSGDGGTVYAIDTNENRASKIFNGIYEDTGDDKKTLDDIAHYLTENDVNAKNYHRYVDDASTDENGEQVNTFIRK